MIGYLSQGVGVGTHVGENDEDVLLTLIGQELSRGQRDTRGDDTLNPESNIRLGFTFKTF